MNNRTPELDHRIGAHEAAHCLIGLIIGNGEIGGATIEPGPEFSGRVWGVNSSPLHLGSPIDIAKDVLPIWPGPGENRTDTAEFFTHAYHRVLELVAGGQGEIVLHPDYEPLHAIDDNKQAVTYASLICCSPNSVDAFLEFARHEARTLLEEHRSCLLALADVLVVRRTMSGDEINQIIAEALVLEDLAAEKARRAAWASVIEGARAFAPLHDGEPDD